MCLVGGGGGGGTRCVSSWYCCLVSSFGLLVSFQLVIGILQHFSIVLVSYRSLVFLLV